jgi:uncharacterized protein YecE (DUF72 family)
MNSSKYAIGTSGYSFSDWVGPFYPPGTRGRDMLGIYRSHFEMLELNFTFYSMPVPRTMQSLARAAAGGTEALPGAAPAKPLDYWVKVNQEITHRGNLNQCEVFMEGLEPLLSAGRVLGLLLQFPQSFGRTEVSRSYLAQVTQRLGGAPGGPQTPLAVEFRHKSWQSPRTMATLRDRGITLVVPDVPDIESLFRSPPALTSRTGYLRLHTRNASQWYAGAQARYDYRYSAQELTDIIRQWEPLEEQVDRTYVLFNNCHGGSAAVNAMELQRLLGELAG